MQPTAVSHWLRGGGGGQDDYLASLRSLFSFQDLRTFNEGVEKHKLRDALSGTHVSMRVFRQVGRLFVRVRWRVLSEPLHAGSAAHLGVR